MKDLTGRELRTGDLILDIRTDYAWYSLGIVQGGMTKGGSIRYISTWSGNKENSKSKFLLKITKEQFEEIYPLKIEQRLNYNQQVKQLNVGYEKVMEIYKMNN